MFLEKDFVSLHLFRTMRGIMLRMFEAEEVCYCCRLDEFKTCLKQALQSMKNPYNNDLRVDFRSEAQNLSHSVVVRRTSEDVQNGVYTVIVSRSWNDRDAEKRCSRRAVEKIMFDFAEAAYNAVNGDGKEATAV